jgi:2-polyprenyl-3-methyl-5-hydroxy-6-metoxy-1,4-benzoquinol methylase
VAVDESGAGSAVQQYYDSYWSASELPRYEIGAVLEGLITANLGPDSDCLDVGCGAGQTYAMLLRQKSRYIGVDISRSAVKAACKGGLDARVIEDAASLPFDTARFDHAVCIEVLEHLFSPHTTVREIHRVLRPGGHLVVSAPNVAYWRLRANMAFGLWNPLGDALSIEQPWRDPHLRFFTPTTMKAMLLEAGFSEVSVGAHGGCFLDHTTSRPTNFGVSQLYQRAERRFPSLLGMTIHATATK